jgi:hypothetical protein
VLHIPQPAQPLPSTASASRPARKAQLEAPLTGMFVAPGILSSAQKQRAAAALPSGAALPGTSFSARSPTSSAAAAATSGPAEHPGNAVAPTTLAPGSVAAPIVGEGQSPRLGASLLYGPSGAAQQGPEADVFGTPHSRTPDHAIPAPPSLLPFQASQPHAEAEPQRQHSTVPSLPGANNDNSSDQTDITPPPPEGAE